MEEVKETYKILLLGDVSVGKTCILLRFSDNSFNDDQISTIGLDYRTKDINIDNKVITIAIWDTAGQEKFKCITKSFYKGAHGILIIYDVTDYKTFSNIIEWVYSIREVANKSIKLMLIANKIDLDHRVVSTEEGKKIADDNNCFYMETSAKTNLHIDKVFEKITKEIYEEACAIKEIEMNFLINHQKQKRKCC